MEAFQDTVLLKSKNWKRLQNTKIHKLISQKFEIVPIAFCRLIQYHKGNKLPQFITSYNSPVTNNSMIGHIIDNQMLSLQLPKCSSREDKKQPKSAVIYMIK